MNDRLFNYRQCWTCLYVVYDIDMRQHKCQKTGEWLRHNVHLPTDCKDWSVTREESMKQEDGK